MNIFTPKGFLQVGGVVLAVVGILGFIGLIGPTPERSLFGSYWWFDNGENWAHLILGVVALGAAYMLKSPAQLKGLVILVGLLGLLIGLIGFFLPSGPPNFLGANLENPADNILHIVVGLWALAASMMKSEEQTMSAA